LIESANVRYSEVNVDGNVHFIGTQGVGKSTLLRALLFFYNANQLKLGIPLGKKSFVDFYFPFQNSYIIYEVMRETGAFCVMVFKSQGRVCFRFLDTNYDKKHFIDAEGRIFESWDKIKLAFGKDINYTRKIDRYEDYRNVLYGNSQGLGAEFRKYAMLESKQYQNIPRAIQHVFLNYKVESEFIKDTIIKSLNEDEIKIDLSNYAHHLKDFDTQLNDIRKWTDKTKNGEIIVRKQAEQVATIYLAIKSLEREKKQLSAELEWQLNEIKKQQPKIAEKLYREETNKTQLQLKIADTEKRFQTKKEKITAEINVYVHKLKDAKSKMDEYTNIDIQGIIQRVAKKADWETEKENLSNQKVILEANFTDIKHKYELQINQLTNQLTSYQNLKQTEENNLHKGLFQYKEQLAREYDKLFDEIKKLNIERLELAKNLVEEKKAVISQLQIKKAGTKHKRFFESEIEKGKADINGLNEKIRLENVEIKLKTDEAEAIKRQWELEKDRTEEICVNKKEVHNQQVKVLNERINSIVEKIENRKDSLYGWLNNEFPAWEKSIGKVIDEDNILFHSGLSPQKVATTDMNFYGVKIDLSEISKSVKTVADYQKDKASLLVQIEGIQKSVVALTEQLNSDLENLKRKHQPKITKCKDAVRNSQYTIEQSIIKLDEAKVNLADYVAKAESEKHLALELLEKEIETISEAKLTADNAVTEIENGIKKQIDSKRKEKEKKAEAEQVKLNEAIVKIGQEIADKKTATAKQVDEIKANQKKEFEAKGADTIQIAKIDEALTALKTELEFIEKNRDKVADYNKDKRELFDNVESFKNQKAYQENQLTTEQVKFDALRAKLFEDIGLLKKDIELINVQLANIKEDIEKYEAFKLTECYKITPEATNEIGEHFHSTKRCIMLIDELNSAYYKGIDRYRGLQEWINKFNGNFSAQNIFSFKTNLIEQSEYFQFAEDLNEFIEEDKISLYEKRVNELFANIIKQVGKETTDLLSKEGEIQSVISDINKDFVNRNFAGVIKSIQLRVVQSSNKVVHLLTEIKKFNDENVNDLGVANLFSTNELSREDMNKKATGLLMQLVKEIADYKHNDINLSDSFELEFKIVENDNDTNWVQNLANVGSDGTDVLVKAMINIMLLNVFKEGATKHRFKDFKLHCMMDEIGKLHPTNVRGILKFANDRNIMLINSSPQSFDALAYKYTYKLAKDDKSVTIINRLITNNR